MVLMSPTAIRRLVLLGLFTVAAAQGCASLQTLGGPEAFARLESAVTDDKYDNSLTRTEVRVVRDDVVVSPALSMRLMKGDSITTARSTQVVMTFAAGYEVTLDTGTAIYIENPSIFLKWGRAFIRRLTGTADTLDVHTRHATLHDVGTSYVVTVLPTTTTVRVESGSVVAKGRVNTAMPWTRYEALQGGVIGVNQQPTRMETIDVSRLEQELSWVRRVDRITTVTVPQLDSLTEAQARATLEKSGLRTFFVTRRATGRYAVGHVVESSPGAGQRVRPGTYVNLVLEKAPTRVDRDAATGAAECVVPVITDRTRKEAEMVLKRANLRAEVMRRIGERDIVSTQVTRAGTRVPCGTVVQFVWGALR
jgi:PASTA domain/FecR protein